MPGQLVTEELDRPLLERLRKQRVVRVRERLPRERPRLLPPHVVLVDAEAHELGDGDGRMRVVELHDVLGVEALESARGLTMDPDHVP